MFNVSFKFFYIDAIQIRLQSKNFILLRGSRGYVMCGYLDLPVADKFKDVAVKIAGVSTIEESLQAKVHSCSSSTEKSGISKSQSIKEVLKLIA